MNDMITKHENKLLKREAYIRRERYVCLGMSVFSLPVILLNFFFEHSQSSTGFLITDGFSVIFFLLAYSYYCTLRIRHIDSIKHYRSL
jgi:uncharacterized protein YqhQ